MVSLEQVKLLESKVIKAIGYVDQIAGENILLREKLESYQKRIDELEVLIQRFEEEQGRIEEGIASALNRLDQFEVDIKKTLAPEKFRKSTVPAKAAQTEAEDVPEPLEGKAEAEEPSGQAGQALADESSPLEAEEKTDDGLILEPETGDLPGDDETSDETLNPGELDIF
jgi:chromosome segregation ATPase